MTTFNELMDALITHQSEIGFFESISRHEPKARPTEGLTAASWFQRTAPVPGASGLAATTVRVEFITRIYTNMLAEPADEIDPDIYDAADTLIAAYTAGFTLGGLVRNVDVLGAYGEALQTQAGYLNQQGALYRVFDVITPLIVNDMYTQTA